MSTPYSEIYDTFLSQITDYNLLSYTPEELDILLLRFLKNAIPNFKYCKVNLSDRDDLLFKFNVSLSDLEQQILACLMISSWIDPSIYNIELLKMVLNDKDFKMYSQANHLEKLLQLKQSNQDRVDGLIIEYTYDINGLDGLK